MDAAASRKLLGLVGLGVRGRLAVVGVQMVREAALKGKLAYAIVAPDVSRHSLDKIVPLLEAKRIRYTMGPGASELGQAVGKEQTAVVGIVDWKLARGVRAIVEAADAGRDEAAPDGGRDTGAAAPDRRGV